MELSKFNSSLFPLVLGCATFISQRKFASPHSAKPTSDRPLHHHPTLDQEDQGTASYCMLPYARRKKKKKKKNKQTNKQTNKTVLCKS
jgi:hypothetical protein